MDDRKAKELVDEMAAEPTLDAFFNRNPKELTDDDLRKLVAREREKRAQFINKDASK